MQINVYNKVTPGNLLLFFSSLVVELIDTFSWLGSLASLKVINNENSLILMQKFSVYLAIQK